MKKIYQRIAAKKRAIRLRLRKAVKRKNNKKPVFSAKKAKYELGDRSNITKFGGIGLINRIIKSLRFDKKIDSSLNVLKQHKPYHESDHVLNIAYNIFTGGKTLDDIDDKRNETAFLDAIGAESIPDPTTSGDFCRRFSEQDIQTLMDTANEARAEVWAKQSEEFFELAKIDGDGTIVKTYGETKEGMDISYKGEWGYHPLLISLANTQEPLFIFNRSGNRTSAEGAAHYFARAAALCKKTGFKQILLRGDTDFSQAEHLDDWDKAGYKFIFGYDARQNLRNLADNLEDECYSELVRKAEEAFNTSPRKKPVNVKQIIVEERGYKDIRLVSEDVAEFPYKPRRNQKECRIVVLRKNLLVSKGNDLLFPDTKYFFYITNYDELTAEMVVKEAGQRCNQENLIAQLGGGIGALRAPVNTLEANWAYMVMASLAWSFKAWIALLVPVHKRWHTQHTKEKEEILHMEFRRFAKAFVELPCQIIKKSRQIHFKLLSWNYWQHVFFRIAGAMA